jgi:(p)ppGpp synthase/HD superfamily hydrolase
MGATTNTGKQMRDKAQLDTPKLDAMRLVEIGWMLQDVGLDNEIIAASYLHDTIEDCGHTQMQLAQELGSARMAAIIQLFKYGGAEV